MGLSIASKVNKNMVFQLKYQLQFSLHIATYYRKYMYFFTKPVKNVTQLCLEILQWDCFKNWDCVLYYIFIKFKDSFDGGIEQTNLRWKTELFVTYSYKVDKAATQGVAPGTW